MELRDIGWRLLALDVLLDVLGLALWELFVDGETRAERAPTSGPCISTEWYIISCTSTTARPLARSWSSETGRFGRPRRLLSFIWGLLPADGGRLAVLAAAAVVPRVSGCRCPNIPPPAPRGSPEAGGRLTLLSIHPPLRRAPCNCSAAATGERQHA